VNNLRDYHVFEMIRQPIGGQLGFGKSMSFRYFYVLGANVDSIKNTILEYNLIGQGLDTSYVAPISEVDSLRYSFQFINQEIIEYVTGSSNGLLLRTSPFSDSYPLFKLSSNNGIDVLTSDPYYFSDFAYDGNTSEIKLLGFRDVPTVISLVNDTICYGGDYVFSDGTIWTDLYQDTSQISELNAIQSGWDSLVIHNIITRPQEQSIDVQQACFSYTWIDGITYAESDSSSSIILTNQFGCDSIVQLNLTINTVDVSIEVDELHLQSLAVNALYQWVDCNNQYSELQDQEEAIYEVESNGSYAVVVTQGSCMDTSDCITLEMVDLSINDLVTIGLYPNPTTGEINLNGFDQLKGLKKIEIKNNLGITLKELEVGELKIDLSDFSNGLYYFEALVNEKTISVKIIKQ